MMRELDTVFTATQIQLASAAKFTTGEAGQLPIIN